MEACNSIVFGRETLPFYERKEWLATNGIGGYASGTVAGILSRRYHGLLVAALKPPLGRTLLGVKVDEKVLYDSEEIELSANRWASGSVSPAGYQYIESFYLDGTIPVWQFAFGDALLEKRIWMERGKNTSYVCYEVKRAFSDVKLTVKAMVNDRGCHNTAHAGNWRMDVESIERGFKVNPFQGAAPFYVLSDRAHGEVKNEWYYGYFLAKEEERGLDSKEDHLHAGTFEILLKEGETVTFLFSTEKVPDLDGAQALLRRKQYEKGLLTQKGAPPWIQQLHLAADAFLVDRSGGKTVIAGYPWFGDWGRDAMISLPGLTLTTGRTSVAKSILETFAKYVDQGMLPNRFPDEGETPEYNTADATLWYFEAIKSYFAATQDRKLIETLFPILAQIIQWHEKGTRYQIRVDPKDGLLHAGEGGVQLTWMDAKIGNWAVTPRTGKPVEINALWLNALRIMGAFARLLGRPATPFDQAADKAAAGFQRFWNADAGYCYDVLDGPEGNDPTLRPNQIFAVSLLESPFSETEQKQIVEICGRSLLTSHGLRSLAPSDPRYSGSYSGTPTQRDSVYHQGTVWGWLLGPYSLAHFKVFRSKAAALSLLKPLASHLSEAGLGTCSEIFDGNPPFTPKGCIAQAWTVAEILRAWDAIEKNR
ncbi:MAG: amylo-alpha-1,6-glucosidase [Chlamydiales bacterium]